MGAHQGLRIGGLALVTGTACGISTKAQPARQEAPATAPAIAPAPVILSASPVVSEPSDETPPTGSGHAWPSDRCSSAVYPAGETCSACLARCCGERECQDDAVCLGYRSCVAKCERGLPCARSCSENCRSGEEPVCYLMDCHHKICGHACGG